MNEMFASVSLGFMMMVDIFLGRRSICLRPVVQYEHVLKFGCDDLLVYVVKASCIEISGSCHDESSRCCPCLSRYIIFDSARYITLPSGRVEFDHAACCIIVRQTTAGRPLEDYLTLSSDKQQEQPDHIINQLRRECMSVLSHFCKNMRLFSSTRSL